MKYALILSVILLTGCTESFTSADMFTESKPIGSGDVSSALYQSEKGDYLFKYGIPKQEKCVALGVGRLVSQMDYVYHLDNIMDEVNKRGGNAGLMIDQMNQQQAFRGSDNSFISTSTGSYNNKIKVSRSDRDYNDAAFLILNCE